MNGVLPETITAITGGGGLHYFFKTDRPVQCKNALLPKGFRYGRGTVVGTAV